jgi:hypothetical protein
MPNKILSSPLSTVGLGRVIRPYLIWWRFLGISLSTRPNISKKRRLATLIFSFFLFLVNVYANIIFFITIPPSKSNRTTSQGFVTRAFSWNVMISYGNFLILKIGGHLVVILALQCNWSALWESLKRMNEQINPGAQLHSKWTWITYIGLFYIIGRVSL